jgi:hypothetical protein
MHIRDSAAVMLRSRINRNNKFNMILLLLLLLFIIVVIIIIIIVIITTLKDTFPSTVAASTRRYTAVHPSPFSHPLQYAIRITSTICRSQFTTILHFFRFPPQQFVFCQFILCTQHLSRLSTQRS